MPPIEPELFEALRRMICALEGHQADYAVIGGVATLVYLPARFTDDVDIVMAIPQLSLPGLLDDLAANGFTVDRETAIREWTRDRLTSLHFGPILIDCMQPVIPLYHEVLRRAVRLDVQGQPIRVASPEDLIVMKLIADRPQDRQDVEALVALHHPGLDLTYIETQWVTISDTADPRWQRFQDFLRPPNQSTE